MQGILVEISNHPVLPFKRKQEVICFKSNWKEETVEVFLQMKHYIKNEDDSYGVEINSPSVQNYESKMTASNIRKVDPVNGIECYPDMITVTRQEQYTAQYPIIEQQLQQVLLPEDQWINGVETYQEQLVDVVTGYNSVEETRDIQVLETVYKRITDNVIIENPIGQFDFFDNIIRNYPVQIREMITNFIILDHQVKGKWNS